MPAAAQLRELAGCKKRFRAVVKTRQRGQVGNDAATLPGAIVQPIMETPMKRTLPSVFRPWIPALLALLAWKMR